MRIVCSEVMYVVHVHLKMVVTVAQGCVGIGTFAYYTDQYTDYFTDMSQ